VSVPGARVRPAPAPAPAPRRHLRPVPAGRRRRSRRPRRHLGFVVLSALLVGSLLVALVSIHALLAQSSFRTSDLSERADALRRQQDRLTLRVAELTSPGRLAREAQRIGLRLPDEAPHVITVPRSVSDSHTGVDAPRRDARSDLQQLLGDGP
jgi:cell division protein FtsL